MADTGIEALETSLRLLQVQQLARRGRLREAIEVVAPGGVPPADPLLLQTFAALVTGAGNYRMALSSLGATPVDRTKVYQPPQDEEDDPFAAFDGPTQ